MALFLIKPVVSGGFNDANPIGTLRTLANTSIVDNAAWTEIFPSATLLALLGRQGNRAVNLIAINTSATTVMQVAAMPGTSAPTTEIGDWLPVNSRQEFLIDAGSQSIWFRVAAIT